MGQDGSTGDRIDRNLAVFEPIMVTRPDLKAASVVVCLVPADDDPADDDPADDDPAADDLGADRPALVITRRAPRLRAHAGQWALPGGRRDPGESVEQAALRELQEETGLTDVTVLGQLDDYVTRSGYVMSPVVVRADSLPAELRGAAAEVAGIYRVPLADLDVRPRFFAIPEADRPVIQLPLFGGTLHAPTAAIVHQFCEVALHGRATRVSHYEQPVFAWR